MTAGLHEAQEVALLVLPCAVLDADASVMPGLRLALREHGVESTLVDLSEPLYEQATSELTHLWRRAGHGVVHHGDPSLELSERARHLVDQTLEQLLRLEARVLVFPLLRSSRALTLEALERMSRQRAGRRLLLFGDEPEPPAALEGCGAHYCPSVSRARVAAWVADLSRPAAAPGSSAVSSQRLDKPLPVPPWRPPGWEGTGAGMVAPSQGELAPGVLAAGASGALEWARLAPTQWRTPLAAGRDALRRLQGFARQAMGQLVQRGSGETPDLPSGVPGSVVLPPPPETRVRVTELSPKRPPAAAAEPVVASEPAAAVELVVASEPQARPQPVESPWQRRPDGEQDNDVVLGTVAPWGFNNPPVSLAHLATYARAQGYRASVLDMNIDLYRRLRPDWELLWHVENKNYWSNDTTFELLLDVLRPHLERYADAIAADPAPLLGLSVVDPKERCTIELIRLVKQRAPHKRVILGGPACVTPEYRQIFVRELPQAIDGYVLGEGEQTLCDVIAAVKQGRNDLSDIAGVLCVRDGEALPMKRRKRLTPLDHVPFPGYEDFDLARYDGDELIVEWSRGCIGSCSYCKGKMIDGRYRSHSAASIFDSLKLYVEQLGVRKFTVCDPVLNGDVAVLDELCRLIRAAELPVRWRGEAIPHSGLTAELAQAMAAAGCYELQLGLESGSDHVLERMNKRRLFSVEQAGEVVRHCHEAGIRTALFIIIGFPGEGEEEFLETYRFVEQHAPYIDELKSINSLHVITDTPVHRHPERFGVCLPDGEYHYRWTAQQGQNTIEVRNERIRRLMELAAQKEIYVRETNLAEGKHHDLAQRLQGGDEDRGQLLSALQQQVNVLSSV